MTFKVKRQDLIQMLSDVAMMQWKLGQLGMWGTAQLMHDVTRNAGFEVADILQNKHSTKLVEEDGVNGQ